jgi:hypothetical protein
VVCEIGRVPVRTYETVLTDTFASLATSFIVAIAHLLPASSNRFVEPLSRSASMNVGHQVLMRQWLCRICWEASHR